MQTQTPNEIQVDGRICSIQDCQRAYCAKGFCNTHYQAYRYENNPELRKKIADKKFFSRQSHHHGATSLEDLKSKRDRFTEEKEKRKKERLIWKENRMYRKRFGMAISECKSRKKNNYQWLMEFEDFKKICDMPCTYCNNIFGTVKFGKGLDRIDHKKHYTLDNVLPCCRTCNRIRGDDITVFEARSMIKHLLDLRRNNPPD